jgi:toxin YoeB
LRVTFTDIGWDEYRSWLGDDVAILGKINDLIENARRTPFKGLGKPEPLKGELRGFWSRRITGEHRLVYCVDGNKGDQKITIVQCRYHY